MAEIKRLFLMQLMFIICLSACSCSKGQYLAVEYNRQSRVYGVYKQEVSDSAYSYDLYQNPFMPLKQYGGSIYYYFYDSYDGSAPPHLSVIDPYSGSVRTLCKNPLCFHNKFNYTERCILCDVYDTSTIAARGGYIYYARADKSYFNENTGEIEYMVNDFQNYKDEVEFEYTLIEYDLASGKFNERYKVAPGGYIDNIRVYEDFVYFYETAYELIENQKFSHSTAVVNLDGAVSGSYIFVSTVTGGYIEYSAGLFYDRATQLDKPYQNIKTNRIMLLKENQPYKKVFRLKRLNIKNNSVETLATREHLPAAFDVFCGRIYELSSGGYISYDLDCGTEYKLPQQPGPIEILSSFEAMGASSFQYDQFTKNIYFLRGGSLSKVKIAGEEFRGVRTADLCQSNISWYQLAFNGVYFMQRGDSNVYYALYTDINYDLVPFTAVFIMPKELAHDNGEIIWTTVIDENLYYFHKTTFSYENKYGFTKDVCLITGPYRYSFETGETIRIWPDGWQLVK